MRAGPLEVLFVDEHFSKRDDSTPDWWIVSGMYPGKSIRASGTKKYIRDKSGSNYPGEVYLVDSVFTTFVLRVSVPAGAFFC